VSLPTDVSSTEWITTPAPQYDGNDNVTQATAPNGAVTTFAFNAGDQLTSKVTPADTSSLPSPTTTYAYDADGNLTSQTAPDGNVPGATAGSFTATYGYDAINEQTSMTDPLGGVTKSGYDNAGNKTSVTDPDNNQAQASYNLNHQVTQVTDAAGNTVKTAYDLDGNTISTTNQNGDTTRYTLDADSQVTQVQVPAQAPGATLAYDTTQIAYDQDGNKTQVISPRGIASGITGAYTTQTQYTADNQVSKVLAPYLPGDPTYGTPAETDYSYDADGRPTSVSAPPSGTSTDRNVTGYTYFGNGWTRTSTDSAGIQATYDYDALGEQSSRLLQSRGGELSRTMTWGYYPDGKLASLSDQGVPSGRYVETADATDAGAKATGAWTTTPCGTTSGCDGTQYKTHVSGTGSDSFTWHLYIPADGNYTVYVKYPQVSSATTTATYTVNYSGGTATATVDQTQNAGSGNWVPLGKWAFTQAGKNQQVTLATSGGGTVAAEAVQVVRDNSADTNNSSHAYAYKYDANGSQDEIADTSKAGVVGVDPAKAVVNTVTVYDQDGRPMSVTEENASGGTVHSTTYGYDAASNRTAQAHDNAQSAYTYNNLNQLVKETDATSSSDPSPHVSTFAYTPAGQVASEVKPNGNTVTATYYANRQLYNQTEKTSGGTLVSSHTYTYDPNGNTTQNVEQLMSADDSGSYLNHTLAYTYTPMDQIATATTDGTPTESYTHDANSNVTKEVINGTETDYGYSQGRLVTAIAGGSTANYNYDPFGRLDTVTSSAGQTLQSNTYDGFDRLASSSQLNTTTGSMDTTAYSYDSLNRMASQTTAAGTSSFSYLGLSGSLASESDQSGTQTTHKAYDYTPGGARLSQDTTANGTTTPGYYTYNTHSDVEAVTGATGTTTATYGYTAYGSPVTSMFTGADKNNATSSSSSTAQPYCAYRYNAMRWDGTSGQYDMGFRDYDQASTSSRPATCTAAPWATLGYPTTRSPAVGTPSAAETRSRTLNWMATPTVTSVSAPPSSRLRQSPSGTLPMVPDARTGRRAALDGQGSSRRGMPPPT